MDESRSPQQDTDALPEAAGPHNQLVPFVPSFAWRPGQSDFPVALVDPAASLPKVSRQRRIATTNERDLFPHIEVLAAPAQRGGSVARVAMVLILIGVAAAAVVMVRGSERGQQTAAEATATTQVNDTAASTVTPSVDDTLRRSNPGFGGGLPAPTATPTDDDEPAEASANSSPTEFSTLSGSGVLTVSTRDGDTLVTVAERFGLEVSSLIWSNDIEDAGARLEAGTTVRVPKEDGVAYEVQSGDTIASIAERFYVEPEDITGHPANAMEEGVSLEPGDLILIPGGSVSDRGSIAEYTVQEGDTVSKIASYYALKPQTIVWANELPRPNLIHPGQTLIIPPGDGALVRAKEGDTVESIASRFDVDPADVYNFEFNGLDGDAVLQVDQLILVPGNFLPPVDEGEPLTAETVAGEGVVGPATGSFIWPTEGWVSQEFHAGHQAIDVANEEWTPVNAADGGIVIFAGWNDHGLGYAVGIDHGNGFQTWYAHFAAQPYVEVGQVIWQGGYLGPMGTTGRSTGPHLHFAILKDGAYQNPMDFLQ